MRYYDSEERSAILEGVVAGIVATAPRSGENIKLNLDLVAAALIEALGNIIAPMARMRTSNGRKQEFGLILADLAEIVALAHANPSEGMMAAMMQTTPPAGRA